jgi:hypothetical protein
MVNKEGEMVPVYLTHDEVEEVMFEMEFNKSCFIDPLNGLTMVWEVELLPSIIL